MQTSVAEVRQAPVETLELACQATLPERLKVADVWARGIGWTWPKAVAPLSSKYLMVLAFTVLTITVL